MIKVAKIKGYEGLYDIYSDGRVYSNITKRFLKMSRTPGHYGAVALYKDTIPTSKMVHLLVADAFIPPDSNRSQINHIDGNKYNNKVENLERVTPKENSDHAIKNGLFNPVGENHGSHILKESEIIDIMSRYGFEKIKDIANEYNVTPSTISSIVNAKNWKHITSHIVMLRKSRRKNIEKPCWKCKKTKPLGDFYKDKRNKDGLKSWCKKCFIEDSIFRRTQTKAKTMKDDQIRTNIPNN